MPAADGKSKALETTLASISKKFGDGAIMRLGEAAHLQVDAIPTGSLALDLALGIGGVPRGRITEIYGPESSGKTTLCQHIVAEAQRHKGVCAYIDMEHALDPNYAARCGVNVENLYISQPDTGEQALEIADMLVHSNAVDVVVVDSVAALVPRAEIEGEMGDSHMGLQARLMSQALRKLSGAIKASNTAMIFTNQLRMKIGVMFGNPETTTGGNALKFYASVRLDVRRIQTIKGGGEATGNRVRVRVGTELEIVTKRGAFFTYNDTRLGQGRENAKEFLKQHAEISDAIEQEIRAHAAEAQQLTRLGRSGTAVEVVSDTSEDEA